MKKTVWSHEKVKVLLNLLGEKKSCFHGSNKIKARRGRIIKLYYQANRKNKFKKYSVRRSYPYHTWNSEEIPEDSKHFWKE